MKMEDGFERPLVYKISFDKSSVYRESSRFRSQFSDVQLTSNFVSVTEHLSIDSTPDNAHFGCLSPSAKKNLMRCVKKFVWVTHVCNQQKKKRGEKGKRTLKFITLTLASAQQHNDLAIKQILLNQFLQELRQDFGLKNYIWKAEKQKNGNIHFHIIVDLYIHWSIIREKWNRIQEKLGYVRRFREAIKVGGFDYYLGRSRSYNPHISFEKVLERWEKGEKMNWVQPPGTEIRNVEKVRNLRAYFSKYFSKDDQLDPGFGRIWFASQSLTKEVSVQGVADKEFWEIWNSEARKDTSYYLEFDYANCLWFNVLDLKNYKKNNVAQLAFLVLTNYAFEFW